MTTTAMMIMMVMMVVLVSGSNSVSTTTTTRSPSSIPSSASTAVSFQVHSFNDLREWPQTLRKIASNGGGPGQHDLWLKVDPHYMPEIFCLLQKRVSHPSEGCLVLNHDEPVDWRPAPYNTTADILTLLADPAIAQFMLPPHRLFIALCFKVDIGSPCDKTEYAKKFLALVDGFFADATAFMQKNPQFQLEFVLDGAGTPNAARTCLAERWRPWNATWIVGSDPQDAATSNNATEGYDRFLINNMSGSSPEDANMLKMQSIAYGKFANGTYPYLFWEPSDQADIHEVVAAYLAGPPNELGLRFAINIDPVQLEVYAGALTGNAWNSFLNLTGTAPFVVALDALVGAPGTLALVVYTDTATSKAFVQPLVLSGPLGTASLFGQPIPLATNASSLPFSSVSATVVAKAGYLLVSDAQSNTDVFQVAVSGGQVVLTSVWSGQVTPFTTSPLATALAFVQNAPESSIWLAQASSQASASSCAVEVSLIGFAPSSPSQAEILVAQTSCAVPYLFSGESVVHLSVDALEVDPANATFGFCESGTVLLVSATTNKATTHVGIACFQTHPDGSTTFVAVDHVADVGTQTSVSLRLAQTASGETTIAFAAVAANSYCWNNEKDNKRGTPALCDSTPSSTTGVLSYTIGSLDSLVLFAHLAAADASISSCSPYGDLKHGMYDMGYAPSASLFVSSSSRALGILELHTGLNGDESDSGNCGLALPHKGQLVLDGFNLRWE
ncbi:hypothetical protein CAOG_007474 [Capsaspora owczarzaki ATCC 30864]|uniref:Uncharacterized protein n=2 Tax=Capsaspora owczarzaki (strain ATCC 30864) TaxID=595528 RepID=A0A0D2X508_CAPO3|nr:hypothetical protein CAOG_007474 [Capsaspora owczarzaki ATCC 30864]